MIETTEVPSPNFDERNGTPVTILVLHYTGMPTGEGALKTLTTPASKVSSHYLVMEDGAILRLVQEDKRAWHAGRSWWRGRRDVNADSVGIEIVNPGHEWGYRAFPAVQMAAVLELCRGILSRHAIPARNVVGHSDIAPDRKQDPGELFPWAWLAAQGVGVWTDEVEAPGDILDDLAAIGYDVRFPAATLITAFQRHFLPDGITGVADARTAGRLAALRRLLDG